LPKYIKEEVGYFRQKTLADYEFNQLKEGEKGRERVKERQIKKGSEIEREREKGRDI
jgi:hypothetical protein